jgi:uncharacterized membrane protein
MAIETFDEGPVTKTNIGRLTNGIFVFTLLLLFKNVRLPSFADTMHETKIDTFGLMQIPDILSFVNAFLIIALIWIMTFHIFHQIKKVDRRYISIHFGLLILIVFIPITSHLYQIFEENSIIAFFFHTNIFFISIFLMGEWYHCTHTPNIISAVENTQNYGCFSRKILYIPLTAVIGILLSLYDIALTRNLYYGTMIIFFLDWFLTTRYPCNVRRRKR